MKILPNEDFIFFADEDNVPYGVKTREQVLLYVEEAFKFLIAQNVGAIVVACNTATSAAVRAMRQKYSLPIVGMEPAIKRALDLFPNKKFLVTATEITINGEKLFALIDRLNAREFAELKALSPLVEFAERMEFNSNEVENYLREQFAPYDFKNFSSIVLGCTHFNYFKDTMKKILPPHIKFLDGNAGTLNYLIKLANLKVESESKKFPHVEYFYSGRRVTSEKELARLEKYLRRLDDMYLI
jgi:glutamate racemase